MGTIGTKCLPKRSMLGVERGMSLHEGFAVGYNDYFKSLHELSQHGVMAFMGKAQDIL